MTNSNNKMSYKASAYKTRHRKKWTTNECIQLQREYELLHLSTHQIALRHKRSERAILFKLKQEIKDFKEDYENEYSNNLVYNNSESDTDSDYVYNSDSVTDSDSDVSDSDTQIEDEKTQIMEKYSNHANITAFRLLSIQDLNIITGFSMVVLICMNFYKIFTTII